MSYRHLARNGTFTAINIAGLSMGIAILLLIGQYVAFEWGANRFHKNFRELYRVNMIDPDGKAYVTVSPGLAQLARDKFSSIQSTIRIAEGIGSGLISYQPAGKNAELISFREENICYADENFFNEFSFPLMSGDARLPAGTVAITAIISNKLFGSSDPIGKTIVVNNQFGSFNYIVAAVLKEIPAASDIRANLFLSFQTLQNPANRDGNDWADPDGMDSEFVQLYMRIKDKETAFATGKRLTDIYRNLQSSNQKISIALQPFEEVHLAPSFSYTLVTYGNLSVVAAFILTGLLILVIAWVNYINLSTAQVFQRSKQIGMKKVLGASRMQVILQYLAETILITITSAILSLLIVALLQPAFNSLTGKPLSLNLLFNQHVFLYILLLLGFTMLLAGFYVAFVLSSIKPVLILKTKIKSDISSILFRKGLVVFQFTISIILIFSTIVLFRQLQYMKSTQLGMDVEQLLVIKGPTISTDGQAERNMSFKNALGSQSFVRKYAGSNNIPGQGYNFATDGITRLNPIPGDAQKNYSMFICDEQFFDTYQIEMKEGKGFSSNDAASGWNLSRKVVLNQSAARLLGFSNSEQVVGQKIIWNETYEITGLVKDYHHLGLKDQIRPTIFLPSVSFVYFSVKMDMVAADEKIAKLKELYRAHFPGDPFEYFFADEAFSGQYHAEKKLGTILIACSGIAIFIACMGLFGLTTFAVQQRVKEIGIRKVLGAAPLSIIRLLSSDFIGLLIVSFLIASPLAWWGMNRWLVDFAYRTTIEWWIPLSAGIISLFIAVITIGTLAFRAASTNPVKNLRTE